MKLAVPKVVISILIGAAVAVLGFRLLVAQKEPIKPFDYLSFSTAVAGFVFSLYQVVQESAARESQRKILSSLLESSSDNIARVYQFSLKQDPSKNVSELLLGVLQQERTHIAGLLRSQYDINTVISNPYECQSIPNIELIEGQDRVRAILKEFTNQAQDFLYIVGGRSRDKDYLQCITNRLKRGDLEYLRIVTGNHIREPLFNHLLELHELVSKDEDLRYRVSYLDEDKYGSFTVTRDAIFWAMPSSTATQLTTGVLIRSSKVASDFRAHVIALSSGEREQKDIEFFRSICKEFWSNGGK